MVTGARSRPYAPIKKRSVQRHKQSCYVSLLKDQTLAADSKECPDCEGTGEVERERVIGGVDANGPWQSYWLYWTECDSCRGSGEVTEH